MNKIESIQEFELKIIGMRFNNLYKISINETEINLERCQEKYRNGVSAYEPEEVVSCSLETFINILNACFVMKWDGFYGKHPRGVLDGRMFDFSAKVNGGHSIKASGSENFPKGFRELVRTLDEMLADGECCSQ